MKISIICSDERHPVNEHLERWISSQNGAHYVEIVRRKSQLSCGDILFMVSCSEIITALERSSYRFALVLHASDLPRGRGWSPHIWEIVQGSENITISLLEAEDKVDSGRIWRKINVEVPPHALWDEINQLLFNAEIQLIEYAIQNCNAVCPTVQALDIKPTYYPRRSLGDSKINPSESIASQFNNIRVCDPVRYPAFFELHGKKYKIILEKLD